MSPSIWRVTGNAGRCPGTPSPKVEELREFEALPEDVKTEIRSYNLTNFIEGLETIGIKNAKKKLEGWTGQKIV